MILSVNKLVKRFGGLVAVNELDMDVRTGCINSLIGPNGSGKTTTLNQISGVLKPTGGDIVFDGKSIVGKPEHMIARAGIRRTFQNIKLFNSMTAIENVMLGAQGQDKSIIEFIFNPPKSNAEERMMKDKAAEKLRYIGLLDLSERQVKDLPYGQQKRIEIARALMTEPKLLLLDEPATGLNNMERIELVSLLQKIRGDGITILLIEHNMDVVMTISEWITVLNFGTKIAEGTPFEIQNDDHVIAAYLGTRFKKKG